MNSSMNLKNFSLLKEDYDHYLVGHPKGKSIKVSKAGLSDKAHELIKKLKPVKMAEGGEVEDKNDSELPESIDEQFPLPSPTDNASTDPSLGQEDSSQPASEPPSQQSAQVPEPSLPQAPSPNPMYSNTALEKAKQSIQGGVNAEAAIGKQEADAYGDMPQLPTPNEIFEKYQARDQALQQAYAAKTIDPDRYWNNKDTGSKLTASIGLLLSGIGSGLSGQPNFAMQQLNNGINRDIEAQKMDKESAGNLWKMNRELLGNDLAANAATQNMYLNAAKVKIMQAQGQFAGPLAQARAAQGILQIDQQIAQNNRMQTLLSPQVQAQLDPSVLVPMMVPAERQKEVFTEINQAKAATQNQQELMSLFDKAAKENRILPTLGGLITPPSIKAMDALILPMIHDAEGRVNEFEQHTIQNLMPQLGDKQSTINAKREALNAFINQKRQASTAKGFGIDLNNYRPTAPLPQMRQMNGANYQKVPGGWKKVS